MKIIKTILFLFIPFFSFSQQIVSDSVFVSSQGQELAFGDDLIIGYPSGNDGDFLFVSNDTKKKLGFASKLAGAAASVGSGVIGVGIGSGSVGAIKTGVQVAGVAGSASQVAGAGEILLKGENELTGQHLRILKFDKSGNKKRGEHFYAIVAGDGRSNFKIELEPAISTKELAGHNNELFEGFDVN